jgi:hypothetical protein
LYTSCSWPSISTSTPGSRRKSRTWLSIPVLSSCASIGSSWIFQTWSWSRVEIISVWTTWHKWLWRCIQTNSSIPIFSRTTVSTWTLLIQTSNSIPISRFTREIWSRRRTLIIAITIRIRKSWWTFRRIWLNKW